MSAPSTRRHLVNKSLTSKSRPQSEFNRNPGTGVGDRVSRVSSADSSFTGNAKEGGDNRRSSYFANGPGTDQLLLLLLTNTNRHKEIQLAVVAFSTCMEGRTAKIRLLCLEYLFLLFTQKIETLLEVMNLPLLEHYQLKI